MLFALSRNFSINYWKIIWIKKEKYYWSGYQWNCS